MPVQVSILAEGKVELPVAPGVFKVFRSVTYVAEDTWPRVVYIDLEKDSLEERRRVIAEDMERAKTERPQTLELP